MNQFNWNLLEISEENSSDNSNSRAAPERLTEDFSFIFNLKISTTRRHLGKFFDEDLFFKI